MQSHSGNSTISDKHVLCHVSDHQRCVDASFAPLQVRLMLDRVRKREKLKRNLANVQFQLTQVRPRTLDPFFSCRFCINAAVAFLTAPYAALCLQARLETGCQPIRVRFAVLPGRPAGSGSGAGT